MKKILAIFSLLALILVSLSGCQSPQEKRGITPLPQNQPQEWENKPYKNIGM